MLSLNCAEWFFQIMSRLVFPVNSPDSTRASKPSGHFGKSKYYYIADTADESKDSVIENTSDHFGGQGSPVDLVVSLKPDAMVSIGMGARAKDKFQNAGVPVFKGDRVAISELVLQYSKDNLVELTELCDNSHHHW